MKVHQLMTTKIATISRERNVVDAARVMVQYACGSIIITENDTPIGIITETDLLKKVIAEGKNLHETSVSDIMSTNLITGNPMDSISETSRRMSLAKIRRMIVVDNGKLVGIVSTTDLKRYMKELERDLMDLT